MKVSIIIPIYNGTRYIPNMYQSLKDQTFQDFEIIYVNDGSKDDSLRLLREIEKNDARVSVFTQSNKGICASRNYGIEKAGGEYLIFLDQDDGIELNLVEKYVQAVTEKKADVASFGKIHYYEVDGKVESVMPQVIDEELVTDSRRIIECLFNIDNKKRLMTIWNCIYKKSLIDQYHLRFDEHFKHGDEDGMFNIEYALHCSVIFFSKECYYHYHIRKGISTITKYNPDLLDNYLYYADKVYQVTKGLSEEELSIVKLYLLRFFSNVYCRFCRFNNDTKDKIALLAKARQSSGFRFATSLKVLKYKKIIPKKYLYWDGFNTFYNSGHYGVANAMLDGLRKAKKRYQ